MSPRPEHRVRPAPPATVGATTPPPKRPPSYHTEAQASNSDLVSARLISLTQSRGRSTGHSLSQLLIDLALAQNLDPYL